MKQIKLEVKRFFHTPLIYFIGIVWILYIYSVRLSPIAIAHTYLSTTLYILIFSAAGFYMMMQDKKQQVYDIVTKKVEYYFVKLIAGVIYALIAIIPLLIYNLVIYFVSSKAIGYSWYIVESVQYVLLYYFLVALIGMVLGMIIGSYLPTNGGLVFVLLCSIILGPLARQLIGYVPFLRTQKAAFFILYALNIAQHNNSGLYPDGNYGLEVEAARFMMRLVILGVLLVLYFLPCRKELRKNRGLAVFITLLVAFVGVGSWYLSKDHYLLKPGRQVPDSRSVEALWDYEQMNQHTPQKEDSSVIKRIEATVDLRDILRFDGAITVELGKQTDTLYVSLYHGFTIDSIQLDGNTLSFD